MATLYDRKDSPYWWAKVWDVKKRGWWPVRTDYRKDDPTGKRKALMFASALDRTARADRPLVKREAWDIWVPRFLKDTYAYNTNTLTRYQNAWNSLFLFLTEKAVLIPRHLEYRHSQEYIDWRTKQARHCGKPINRNTAITEIKVMSRIMREAHRRGYTEANPFYQLGLKRTDVKEKPEILDDELAIIKKALKKEPKWMQTSFDIAMGQGCRLSETAMPLDRIDLGRMTIQFHAKGRNGEPHIFTTALNPDLKPLIEQLKKSGATHTLELPEMASKEWHNFFKKIGLPHISFHSTRVTVITKMARAGVTQQKAMRFVGHASETIHRTYQRMNASDVADVAAVLSSAKRGKP